MNPSVRNAIQESSLFRQTCARQTYRAGVRLVLSGAALLLACALGGCVMETGNGDDGREGQTAGATAGSESNTLPGPTGAGQSETLQGTNPRVSTPAAGSGPWPWVPNSGVSPAPNAGGPGADPNGTSPGGRQETTPGVPATR
jgi:hypothetical protein